MSEPAVLNWDRIIHKNVRSKDFEDVGNVFAIDGDEIIKVRTEKRVTLRQVEGKETEIL